jgi:hypothetical protein
MGARSRDDGVACREFDGWMEKHSKYQGFDLISRQSLSEHTVEITTEDLGLMAKLQGAFGSGQAICRGQTRESAMAAARRIIDELLS